MSSKRLAVVAGGGWVARMLIAEGKAAGLSQSELDLLGINATRMNAASLLVHMGKTPEVPHDIDAAAGMFERNGYVVMGGTVPGHTTDAVSAMLAERIGAVRLVNVTSVDGVYTADPRNNPDARRYAQMDYGELERVVEAVDAVPGVNVVVGHLAAAILKRCGMELAVVSGEDAGNVASAIKGERFHGTLVGAGCAVELD